MLHLMKQTEQASATLCQKSDRKTSQQQNDLFTKSRQLTLF